VEPLRSAGAGLAGGHRGTVGRGAVYASQVSESAPNVVYTASVEEVAAESQGSLKVDINSADLEEFDELPGVGPEMAEAII